jgi:hypothetical protein
VSLLAEASTVFFHNWDGAGGGEAGWAEGTGGNSVPVDMTSFRTSQPKRKVTRVSEIAYIYVDLL